MPEYDCTRRDFLKTQLVERLSKMLYDGWEAVRL